MTNNIISNGNRSINSTENDSDLLESVASPKQLTINHIRKASATSRPQRITTSISKTISDLNSHSHLSSHSNSSSTSKDTKNVPLERSGTNLISRITTIQLDDSKIVPKNKRRGLLSNLCLIPEYTDARELPKNLRYLIVFIIAFCAMLGPMGTSILLPASDDAIRDLHTDITILNVAIGVYLITLGVIPLWWSNFSERHGRRSIYIISFIIYLGFTIGCALSKTVNVLIGFRILSGGCAASVQSVGAGTIGDLYPMTSRGAAMGIFYLGPLAGPLLAPIIGGAITSNKSFGWRATQWFLVILSGICCLMIIFLLPETLRRQDNKEAIRKILRERRKMKINKDDEEKLNVSGSDNSDPSYLENLDEEAIDDESEIDDEEEIETLDRMMTRMSSRPSIVESYEENEMPMDSVVPLSKIPTTNSVKIFSNPLKRLKAEIDDIEKIKNYSTVQKFGHYFKIYGYGPLKSFVFLRYPPVALAIGYSAPCFAALYVLNMTLTYAYSRPPYSFTPVLVGLVYIPNSVTYFIASIWGGRFNDYLLQKKIKKYGIVAPEARFGINVYVAAAILPSALLITGWCLDKKEHWVTPLVGTSLFGFAQMIVIGVTITYLADCLPGRGATGIALSNFIRMLMAAGVSFATEPLIKAIGIGPLFSICAGVTAILSLILVFIIKNGDYWRENFDLEKLYDIVDG